MSKINLLWKVETKYFSVMHGVSHRRSSLWLTKRGGINLRCQHQITEMRGRDAFLFFFPIRFAFTSSTTVVSYMPMKNGPVIPMSFSQQVSAQKSRKQPSSLIMTPIKELWRGETLQAKNSLLATCHFSQHNGYLHLEYIFDMEITSSWTWDWRTVKTTANLLFIWQDCLKKKTVTKKTPNQCFKTNPSNSNA